MKSAFLSSVLLLLFLIVGQPQQSFAQADSGSDWAFSKSLKPVFWEFTSTGCPSCGRWGKPKRERILSTHGNDLLHLAVHVRFNDPMENELTQAINENRPARKFTPQFWVNEQQTTLLVSSGQLDSNQTYDLTAQYIDTFQATLLPKMDGKVTKEGSNLIVDYAVERTEISTQERFIACYLVQDGLNYPQSGSQGGSITHDNVLTATADQPFGLPLQPGQLGVQSYQVVFNTNSYQGSTSIVLVLWEKVAGTYYSLGAVEL